MHQPCPVSTCQLPVSQRNFSNLISVHCQKNLITWISGSYPCQKNFHVLSCYPVYKISIYQTLFHVHSGNILLRVCHFPVLYKFPCNFVSFSVQDSYLSSIFPFNMDFRVLWCHPVYKHVMCQNLFCVHGEIQWKFMWHRKIADIYKSCTRDDTGKLRNLSDK